MDAAILNLLSCWYKDIFAQRNLFTQKHLDFMDQTIMRFRQDVRFYLTGLDSITPLRKAGLPSGDPGFATALNTCTALTGLI